MAPILPVKFRDFNPDIGVRKKTEYEKLFLSIDRTCRTQYEGYDPDLGTRCHEKPWETSVKKRAENIAGIAFPLSQKMHQTPGGWRSAIEPELFARLDVEVVWCASS